MLNESGKESLSLKKQLWNVKDLERLLEFILLNPHLVGSSACSPPTITALHNFISPLKTFQECEIKMSNLKAVKKSYGKMVDYLKQKTQLSEKWILEKKKESGYFHIAYFHKELMGLKESETIDHQALRMFLSNFYHKEAMFLSAKSSFPNIFTNPSSGNLSNLQANRLKPDDSSSKVIELKIIDSTERTENTFNSFDKLQQRFLSTETHIKENIGGQKNSQIVCEYKETQRFELKTFKWNYLQKLSYLVFILKYQKEFQNSSQFNLTESLVIRLQNFMRPITVRNCRTYHVNSMEKHQTVENIISSLLNDDLYIKENEIRREIERINTFFEQDLKRQLNAFASKSKLTLESPDEQVLEITRSIAQELVRRKNFKSLNQQTKNPMFLKQPSSQKQSAKLQSENQLYQIHLPVELTIVFEAENEEKNQSQLVEKVQNDENQFLGETKKTRCNPRRRNIQNYERQNFGNKKKKQRLKEKKIEKLQKSVIQRLQNQKEEIFVELEEDFDQFNVIAGNYSQSKQDQSQSENKQSINQSDCENQESVNVIKKPHAKQQDIRSDSMLNQISQKLKTQLEHKKLSVIIKETCHQKQTSNNFWTLSQRMKIITFMTVNKLIFLQGHNFDKQGIREQLSKYIGTQRSIRQCKTQIHQLREIYNFDMNNLLVEEGKKLKINEELLQKWKQISDSYSSRKLTNSDNYCLEVNVLPMTYVMGSPDKMVSQLYKLIKKGPVLEINMREVNKEIQEMNNDRVGKIEGQKIKLKEIKFRVKLQGCKIKLKTIVKIKFTWNSVSCYM